MRFLIARASVAHASRKFTVKNLPKTLQAFLGYRPESSLLSAQPFRLGKPQLVIGKQPPLRRSELPRKGCKLQHILRRIVDAAYYGGAHLKIYAKLSCGLQIGSQLRQALPRIFSQPFFVCILYIYKKKAAAP